MPQLHSNSDLPLIFENVEAEWSRVCATHNILELITSVREGKIDSLSERGHLHAAIAESR